jgi:hypothetical protein
MHLGEFPNGIEFSTFVMARQNYPFEKMSVQDHQLLFAHERTRPPTATDLEGNWRGTLIFLATPDLSLWNQANPEVFEASFHSGAASYRLRGGLDLASPPELRRVDEKTMLGRWTLPDLAPELFLRLQNYTGSSASGLELRFVLTRS